MSRNRYCKIEVRKGLPYADLEWMKGSPDWTSDEYKDFIHYLDYYAEFSPLFHVAEEIVVERACSDVDDDADDDGADNDDVDDNIDKTDSKEKASSLDPVDAASKPKIVGFALAKVENSIFNFCRSGNRTSNGHITNLVVLSDHRNKGIAKKLMNQVHERLKKSFKVNSVSLHVRALNQPAIGLYNSLKYEIVSTLPKYYKNGDDALRMELHWEMPTEQGSITPIDVTGPAKQLQWKKKRVTKG